MKIILRCCCKIGKLVIKAGVLVILIALLCSIILCCIKPLFLSEEECKMAKNTLIIAGMGALGTCITVWLALAAVFWRRILQCPKLSIKVDKKLPFCMLLQESSIDSTGGKNNIVEVCGVVSNKRSAIAKDCRVVCKGVYVYNPDLTTITELKKLRTVAFPWADFLIQQERMDISRSLERYFKFIEISYPPQETRDGIKSSVAQADGSATTMVAGSGGALRDRATLVVFIPGEEGGGTKYRIPGSIQSILLHVAVTCVDTSPEVYGIRVDWKGNDPSDYNKPGLFSVQLISENDLIKLIGDEK